MLRELERISDDQSNKLDLDELMAVAASLRERQFVYKDGRGTGRIYDVLVNQQNYYRDLFEAFGDEFIVDQHCGFVGIVPRASHPVLTQLETVLLLLLTKMHDMESRKARAMGGRTQPNEGVLLDEYRTLTGKDKPKPGEVKAALYRLRRAGVIDLGPINEETEMHQITVLPSITQVVTESYLNDLERFSSDNAADTQDEQSIDIEEAIADDDGQKHDKETVQ